MRRNPLVKIAIILGLVLAFVSYGFYVAKDYRDGPKVVVESPEDNQVFKNADIVIKGNAKNISSLFLNGRQIFTNENGDFKEELLIAKGYNIITVSAKDKFNRDIKVIRKIILK